MEHLFNKQGLKTEETRLTAWDEATAACSGFHSVIGRSSKRTVGAVRHIEQKLASQTEQFCAFRQFT
jgi:hypothetical protein